MGTYLIVANQTVGGRELLEHVQRLVAADEPCRFHFVVPATPPHEHLVWTEGEAHAIAEQRLQLGVDRLRAIGVEATGEVGDKSPVLAVGDALRSVDADGVILTTLPAGLSRWLKMSLPERLERRFDLPVTHFETEPEPSEHEDAAMP